MYTSVDIGRWARCKECRLGSGTSTRPFKSCLLVAPSGADTLPVIRALHTAGIAVLERAPGDGTLALALSGEFDVVAWHLGPEDGAEVSMFGRLAAAGTPTVALLTQPTPS